MCARWGGRCESWGPGVLGDSEERSQLAALEQMSSKVPPGVLMFSDSRGPFSTFHAMPHSSVPGDGRLTVGPMREPVCDSGERPSVLLHSRRVCWGPGTRLLLGWFGAGAQAGDPGALLLRTNACHLGAGVWNTESARVWRA